MHMHTHTHVHTEPILRNQVCTWFNNIVCLARYRDVYHQVKSTISYHLKNHHYTMYIIILYVTLCVGRPKAIAGQYILYSPATRAISYGTRMRTKITIIDSAIKIEIATAWPTEIDFAIEFAIDFVIEFPIDFVIVLAIDWWWSWQTKINLSTMLNVILHHRPIT